MIAPDRRILQLAAGARVSAVKVSREEVVMLVVQNGQAMRVTFNPVEACGFGTLPQGAAGDSPPFGGYGELPLQAAE